MNLPVMRKKTRIQVLILLLLAASAAGQPEAPKDFKVKGFHIDLRIQVMTPKALHNFAKELAGFGINTLVMEWEAAYPYNKQATISNKLAYTREEVRDFIRYCNQLNIQVIPLQQCFGHVEYILRNDRYNSLREDEKDISQVCPLKTSEDSLLFSDLFSDIASLHASEYIHIGGDETYLLGHCAACSKKAASEGKSKLFVDYMKMMCELVVKLGKTPIMWADILLAHPEAASELPPETIFVDWNYGWKTDYFEEIGKLQKKGFQFWGSPSIRCHPDNWYVTGWETHFNNQRDFIPYARKAGYEGVIMTSWSTSGLYGFTWDVGYKVINMQQVRNNYPLSGFRILLAAYAQALKQSSPVNPEDFVVSYAIDRFGIDAGGAKKFWQAIMVSPELIEDGKPAKSTSIAALKNENDKARLILKGIKPSFNKNEFAHFVLMADLRDYYLLFKELEARYNAPNFSRSRARPMLSELQQLMIMAKQLDRRFYELNKDFLYDSEIREQNRIRSEPINILYQRLTGIR